MIFRNWVLQNFPFLEDDFDALTDYELFCKMMEYVKQFAKDNEDFNKRLTDLENYVYNLNIQEAVDNKLEEMLEDGTLQEIITSYLQINGVLSFNTVSDMKLSQNLIDGSTAKTLGYSTINDGGGSYYIVREIINTDVIDESHIIALYDNNLVAELIDPQNINPENFSGDSDNEKVQNAINYGITLYDIGIPTCINLNRLFNITNTLTINKTENNRLEFTFNGNNKGGFVKTTSGLLFSTTSTDNSDITFNNVVFKSLPRADLIIFNSNDFINVKFIGCNFNEVSKCIESTTYLQSIIFNNCTISGGAGDFIKSKGVYFLDIQNCIIEQRYDGYLYKQNFDNNYTYNKIFYMNICNNLIEGFHSQNTNSGIIYIKNYEFINFNNNYIENIDYPIYHSAEKWGGTLNILNNRLYQGDRIENKNQKGLLYMVKYYDNDYFRMGNISFENNEIYNTYAIYFDNTIAKYQDSNSAVNKLYYENNKIINSFTSSDYYYNDYNTNTPFNILPVLKLNVSNAVYSRSQWIFKEKLSWSNTLTVSEDDYTTHYKLMNGIFNACFETTQSFVETASYTEYYLGVDIYSDDMISVFPLLRDVKIITAFRTGSNNNKHLLIQYQSNDSTTRNATIACTISLIGNRG